MPPTNANYTELSLPAFNYAACEEFEESASKRRPLESEAMTLNWSELFCDEELEFLSDEEIDSRMNPIVEPLVPLPLSPLPSSLGEALINPSPTFPLEEDHLKLSFAWMKWLSFNYNLETLKHYKVERTSQNRGGNYEFLLIPCKTERGSYLLTHPIPTFYANPLHLFFILPDEILTDDLTLTFKFTSMSNPTAKTRIFTLSSTLFPYLFKGNVLPILLPSFINANLGSDLYTCQIALNDSFLWEIHFATLAKSNQQTRNIVTQWLAEMTQQGLSSVTQESVPEPTQPVIDPFKREELKRKARVLPNLKNLKGQIIDPKAMQTLGARWLPPELWIKIITYLNENEKINLRYVCRALATLSLRTFSIVSNRRPHLMIEALFQGHVKQLHLYRPTLCILNKLHTEAFSTSLAKLDELQLEFNARQNRVKIDHLLKKTTGLQKLHVTSLDTFIHFPYHLTQLKDVTWNCLSLPNIKALTHLTSLSLFAKEGMYPNLNYLSQLERFSNGVPHMRNLRHHFKTFLAEKTRVFLREEVEFDSHFNDGCLSLLQPLTQLRQLDLSLLSAAPAILDLTKLTQLEELDLNFHYPWPFQMPNALQFLQSVNHFERLHYLGFCVSGIPEDSLAAALSNINPRVTSLCLRDIPSHQSVYHAIGSLTHLKELILTPHFYDESNRTIHLNGIKGLYHSLFNLHRLIIKCPDEIRNKVEVAAAKYKPAHLKLLLVE